jgi:hypothetical protein
MAAVAAATTERSKLRHHVARPTTLDGLLDFDCVPYVFM